MRIVGIGDLLVDIYYKNSEFIGINGGKTFANIIFNLGYLNNKTKILGVCGNDLYGTIAIDSLKKMRVDVEAVEIKDMKTRTFYINILDKKISTRSICPICRKKDKYQLSQINVQNVISKIMKDDIIVIDSINNKNIKIIKEFSNRNDIVLDIGYYNELSKMSDEQILDIFKYRFKFININSRVEKYLINRFDKITIFNAEIIIITRGSKGADFIYDNKLINKKLINKSKIVDSNGAGAMFLANFINEYIKNPNIDEDWIGNAFNNSSILTSKVVKFIGARGYFSDLYKIELDLCENH